jgi:hypothetical protein
MLREREHHAQGYCALDSRAEGKTPRRTEIRASSRSVTAILWGQPAVHLRSRLVKTGVPLAGSIRAKTAEKLFAVLSAGIRI